MTSKQKSTAGSKKVVDPHAALREELGATPAGEVRRMSLSGAAYLDWLTKLVAAVRAHRDALVAVPLTPDADLTAAELDRFVQLAELLRDVQDEQDRRQKTDAALTPAQRKALADARQEQRRAVRDIRHAFRDDRAVRAWCASVLDGDSVADLHDDARKLTGFWEQHAARLARFTGGKAALARMASIAAALPQANDPGALDDQRHTFLRNAAYTQVDRTAKRVCVAGRYAFADDKVESRRFLRFKPAKKAKRKGGEK